MSTFPTVNFQTPVTGITGGVGTGAYQNYMASTVEEISLGRDIVTSTAPLPNRVFDIVWKMNLNAALAAANIKSPSVADTEEKFQTPGIIEGTKYLYTLTTGLFTKVIEISQTGPVSGVFTLTYGTGAALRTGTGTSMFATGPSQTNSAAFDLARKLSTDGTNVTSLAADGSQNAYSSLSPNYTTVVSNGLINTLVAGASGNQDGPITSFMNALKGVAGTYKWYGITGPNNQAVQTQVKFGLAQLFDKEPALNNLIGSAATSNVFIDEAKVSAKMQNNSDSFWTKFFSEAQLREVLSAVTDKGSRIAKGETGVNTFAFLPGDTISGMLKVTDLDTTALNSDRWMITLQQT